MADECGNILDAVGKAGDLQHNHAEPEEQVFAEFAIGDRGAEILVRGRNDADVDGLHIAAADADDRPVFEHAEQFDLHVETHVADFVEEERAALGRFEMADAAGMGAGEAALFMPEKFGFDEFAGDRAAVDRGEGLAGAAPSSWIARATSSLPEPDGPQSITEAFERATRRIISRSRQVAGSSR
jgi:hypothetical protein